MCIIEGVLHVFHVQRHSGTTRALKDALKEDSDQSKRIYSLQTNNEEEVQIKFARVKAFSADQVGVKILKSRQATRGLNKYSLRDLQEQCKLYGVMVIKSTAAEKINAIRHQVSEEDLDEDVSPFIFRYRVITKSL